jgi:hypothetical protein
VGYAAPALKGSYLVHVAVAVLQLHPAPAMLTRFNPAGGVSVRVTRPLVEAIELSLLTVIV